MKQLDENNGRMRLSWHQLVWGVSLLLSVSAAWWDLSSHQKTLSVEVGGLSLRIEKLETTIDNNIIPRREAEAQYREIDRRFDRLERR